MKITIILIYLGDMKSKTRPTFVESFWATFRHLSNFLSEELWVLNPFPNQKFKIFKIRKFYTAYTTAIFYTRLSAK